jgi:outer membrane protein assembly factor BamB
MITKCQAWFKASGNIKTPVIMDGRAFFSDDGGNLYAVDLKNGQAIWKAAFLPCHRQWGHLFSG